METKDNRQRGIAPDPAETSRDSQQHQQQSKEGDFRDAEAAESKTSFFDDDYEARKEDEISKEEAKTEEKGNRKKE